MSLTVERLRELLRYDPETGLFVRLVTTSSRAQAGDVVGSRAVNGYLRVMIDGRFYSLHRLACLYMTGEWPAHQMDHRDGVRSNNRWKNLRDVPSSINGQNQRAAHADSQTGYLGVSKNKKGFASKICIDRRTLRLGTYATPQEAHEVYVHAKREIHQGGTL